MNRILSSKYQEELFEETMDNGLKVLLWHKKGFQKGFFMMGTPFGAVDIEQVDSNGDVVQYPAGIAHFLEHKLFESEDNHDVMDDFSSMGANVNAATSYDETCYYFVTSQDITKPLNLLLDFTQKLCITNESVEKEKGIITQEHQMYQQMSEARLIHETFKSLFSKHPLKYEVDGTIESIQNTTVEDLKCCYKINYHPSNMMLIGVSGTDPEIIFDLIRSNQNSKTFPEINKMKDQEWNEPKTVNRELHEFTMEVNKPKVNVAYKLQGIKDPIQREKMDMCLRILFDCAFSSLNPKYQNWLEDGLINDFYGYEINVSEDIAYCMVYAETKQQDAFIELVDKTLADVLSHDIQEEQLEQLKRRYHGQNIRYLNDFESLAIMTMRCAFDNTDVFEILDLTEKLTIEDVRKAQKYCSMENKAIIVCKPNRD